jgi:hypothetical protein
VTIPHHSMEVSLLNRFFTPIQTNPLAIHRRLCCVAMPRTNPGNSYAIPPFYRTADYNEAIPLLPIMGAPSDVHPRFPRKSASLV